MVIVKWADVAACFVLNSPKEYAPKRAAAEAAIIIPIRIVDRNLLVWPLSISFSLMPSPSLEREHIVTH